MQEKKKRPVVVNTFVPNVITDIEVIVIATLRHLEKKK